MKLCDLFPITGLPETIKVKVGCQNCDKLYEVTDAEIIDNELVLIIGEQEQEEPKREEPTNYIKKHIPFHELYGSSELELLNKGYSKKDIEFNNKFVKKYKGY